MEPTSGEYTSNMRVALDRRNPADGAAPPGLKKSRTSKVTLPPALSLHASLSPSSLSLPSLASTRRPVPRTARRRPRALAPPMTAQRPHAAGPRGQGTGPTARPHAGARAARQRGQGTGPPAPTARRRPRPQALSPGAAHARQLRLVASLLAASRPLPPVDPLPPLVPPLFKVNPCCFLLDCSSSFMCERCLM